MKKILIFAGIISLIVLNFKVVTNSKNTYISIKSLIGISFASAKNNNTIKCPAWHRSVIDQYDCSFTNGKYGQITTYYWCTSGGNSLCKNGLTYAWWDCVGKQGGYDMITYDPC